jgi:hypothetical protein
MVVRQYLNGPFNTAYGEGVCLWCSGRTFPLTNKIATNQTSHFIFLFWKLVHFSNFPAISYHFQQYFSDIVAVRFIRVGNDRPVASHWQTLSHNVVHLVLIKIQTRISCDRHWLHIGCIEGSIKVLPHNHSCSLWLSPLWSLHKSKNTTLFHNPEHLVSFMYLIQSLTRHSHKMSQSRLHRLFAWVLFFSGDILRSRISVLPTKSSNIQFFFITAQYLLCTICFTI